MAKFNDQDTVTVNVGDLRKAVLAATLLVTALSGSKSQLEVMLILGMEKIGPDELLLAALNLTNAIDPFGEAELNDLANPLKDHAAKFSEKMTAFGV